MSFKDSFKLRQPEPSKNRPWGPVVLGLGVTLFGAAEGFAMWNRLGLADSDGHAFFMLLRPALALLVGTAIVIGAARSLLRGDSKIELFETHLEAGRQCQSLDYAHITTIRKLKLRGVIDALVLETSEPQMAPECVTGRRRFGEYNLTRKESDVPLFLMQSGWPLQELYNELNQRVQTSRSRTAA